MVARAGTLTCDGRRPRLALDRGSGGEVQLRAHSQGDPQALLPVAHCASPAPRASDAIADARVDAKDGHRPIQSSALLDIHRRRLHDPWWSTIAADFTERGVGTIGIWEKEHHGVTIHETGWMVLPAYQGRGIASAALGLLIERVRVEPRFPSMHAFARVTNVPSNALCRKFDFTLLDEVDFVYAGRPLRCDHWTLETPTR